MSILKQTLEKVASSLIAFTWYLCLSSHKVMMLPFPSLELLLVKNRNAVSYTADSGLKLLTLVFDQIVC